MAKTKKVTKKTYSPVVKTKPKTKKSKFKKKKEENTNPLCMEKQFRKKAVVYKIIDDSIVEPNNASIVYSEEDDSFHEVKPNAGHCSDKTSTPLTSKPLLCSPKLLFKKSPKSKNGDFTTPMKEQVNNVSNMLSNVSIILHQISEGNKTCNQKTENLKKDVKSVKETQNNHSGENSNVSKNENLEKNVEYLKETQKITEKNSNVSKNESLSHTPNNKYVSQLHVKLNTSTKNDQSLNKAPPSSIEKAEIDNSKLEYDSFLQEFYLKTNPHVITEKNQDMSWDQFSVTEKFNISDMIKIDPNLAEFINAPGSTDEKMKYLILKLGELADENETLKKHVDWLTDKYNQQNIELEKQFYPTEDGDKDIETKNPEEMLREYYKLNNKYQALNNHLDDTLRHKETYKKALVLTKSERDALEKDLVRLNEFDDDRERMSELLNIQTALRQDLKNSTDRNTGLRHELKCLNEENFRLRHEMTNAQRIIHELKTNNEKQKHELENLQAICNSQQEEINKNCNLENSYNSKNWFEQVLDEENYDSQNENTDNETDSHNSQSDISLDSVSSGDIENYIENDPIESNENELIRGNYIYNTNFPFRQSLGNKHFIPTSDPIKVKLRDKKINKVCRYYLRDSCKFDQDCLFLHPTQHQSVSHNSHEMTNPPNTHFRSPAHQNHKFPYSSRLKTPPNQRSYPLNQYQVRRYPNSPVRESPYPLENYDREFRSYGKNTWNPHRNEPCFYFMRGVCRYGSGCHFFHPTPETSIHLPHPQH